MRKSNHIILRKALRASPDGATALELSRSAGLGAEAVRKSLQTMPDAYIDRWTAVIRGQHAAVWCVAHVPEHCPKPERRHAKEGAV